MRRETKGLLSFEDFGAVGDGKTDDTEAVQRALDAMSMAQVPARTYRFKSAIKRQEERRGRRARRRP